MKIIPYENGYTFLVESRSRQGHHKVDLTEYRFNGECACEDFRMHCLKIWRVTHTPRDEGEHRTRCAHIIACREWRLNDVLRRLKALEQLPAPTQAQGKITRADLARSAQSGLEDEEG